MMIFHYITGQLEVNTYFVVNEESSRCFIVDPGGNFDMLSYELKKKSLTCEAILLTHGHFDHCGAAAEFQRRGVKVYVHKFDEDKLHSSGNLSGYFGVDFDSFYADELLSGGETLNLCGMQVKVIHTPGHSRGGVCYLVGDALFSGDTLFHESVGRYDMYDSDGRALLASVRKLFSLEGDPRVFTGHGEVTSLQHERSCNPFLFGV